MTDLPNNDDRLLDRLVDGELSTSEQQQLLAALDDPQSDWGEQGWRRCALAFLEAQTLGGHLKAFVSEPANRSTSVATLPPKPSASFPSTRWLAIAAGLLLAFSVGWFSKSTPQIANQPTELANTNPPGKQRQEFPLPDEPLLANSADAVTLLVRDTDGKNQRLQVPLMEVEDLDQRFTNSLPEALRARFRDRGFDVKRRRRFAPMFFEQNQELVPMVVPVDDTYLVPVSRPVY